MDWFRSHHGAPSDSKWLVVARKAKVQPVAIVAVFWSLLDYASQQESRGDIEGFDPESVAAFLGIEDYEVLAIMTALEDKGITHNGRIANWDKRQPKRERDDISVARVQRHRETRATTTNNVTPCNANVTPCNANDSHVTPRGEERRLEEIRVVSKDTTSSPKPPTALHQAPSDSSQDVDVEKYLPPMGKLFAPSDPIPVQAEGLLANCPDYWADHLRLALVGRTPGQVASYACAIVRKWKRGDGAPTAPLPVPGSPTLPRMSREAEDRLTRSVNMHKLHNEFEEDLYPSAPSITTKGFIQ